jgi:Uma2 family endonuclease
MSTAILADAEKATLPSYQALPMETDEALYEFVFGQRVELPPMSIRAVTVVTRLSTLLNAFAGPRQLGEAFMEMLIHAPVLDDEGRNRRPDLVFVSASKLISETPDDFDANAWDVIPDLAIEVTSPTDRAEDQREKVQEYLQLGVSYVWVVYPKLRLIDVYDSSGAVRTVGPDGVLTGDPVLPGLQISLDELFRPIRPPAE